MPITLTCARGHSWEQDSLADAGERETPPSCPICGARATIVKNELLPQTIDYTNAEAEASSVPSKEDTSVPHGARKSVDNAPVSIPGYDVEDELGRGGMGVVYRAKHTKLNRLVALKMILAGSHAGADSVARFLSEAEAVAAFQHPNIVQVFEVGQHEGLPYMALEFVEGGSLADQLKDKPLPPKEAARLVEQIARGMNAAHQAGIVHRDLKPANILLSVVRCPLSVAPVSDRPRTTDHGLQTIPKITDFGLAKKVEGGSGLTQTGVVVGTPNYMAPEQAKGESKRVGPAADVYALGAVLYKCLTGKAPFHGANMMETLKHVIEQEPVAPQQIEPKIPHDLGTICLKCLQKEPQKRYPSAEALAEDLRRWQADEPITARPVGRIERLWRWRRRNPKLAVGMAVFAVFVVVSFVGLISLWRLAELRGQEAMAQQKKSDQNFDMAWQFVNDYFDDAARGMKARESFPGRRKQLGKAVPVRAELIDAAVEHFSVLAAKRPDDIKLQTQLGTAYHRKAQLYAEQTSKALPAARNARDIFDTLCDLDDDGGHEDGLAYAYELMSFHETDPKKQAEAREHSRALRERMVERDPSNIRYLTMAAYAAYNKGFDENEAGRQVDALRFLHRAKEHRQRIAQLDKSDFENLSLLARTLEFIANIQRARNNEEEAARFLNHSIVIRTDVVDRRGYAQDLRGLAEAQNLLALVLPPPKRPIAHNKKNRDQLANLLARMIYQDREIGSVQCALGIAHNNLGHAYLKEGQRDKALLEFENGSRLLEKTDLSKFAARFSVHPKYLLATMSNNVGRLKAVFGPKKAEALEWIVKGCGVLEKLLEEEPNNAMYQKDYRNMLFNSSAACGLAKSQLQTQLKKNPKSEALRKLFDDYTRVQKNFNKRLRKLN